MSIPKRCRTRASATILPVAQCSVHKSIRDTHSPTSANTCSARACLLKKTDSIRWEIERAPALRWRFAKKKNYNKWNETLEKKLRSERGCGTFSDPFFISLSSRARVLPICISLYDDVVWWWWWWWWGRRRCSGCLSTGNHVSRITL